MRVLHLGWGFRPWRPGGLIAYTEDVAAAQHRRGHDVAYLFGGRHLPGLRRPRLHRWRRDGVRQLEVLGAPAPALDLGTRRPDLDVANAAVERIVERVLRELRPDVLHVQELLGMPSSVIGLAGAAGVPTVMTLQDYFPLCPTLKLYDFAGERCRRALPGEGCVRCCRDAPEGDRHLREMTVAHELVRLGRRFPRTRERVRAALAPLVARAPSGEIRPQPAPPGALPPPEAYDRRRVANVAALAQVDVLVAMSHGVADLYARAGVPAERLRTVHLTLDHLARLRPAPGPRAPGPLRFATLNGAVSAMKGSRLLVEAVAELERRGLGERFRLHVHGLVAEDVRDALARSPSVVLEGPYDARALDRLLDDVDVGLVPSVWDEAYAYVGVEFLAKGVPVIGNARGGIPDYVRPGVTGWLNEDATGAGLAAAMARAIEAPGEVAALRRSVIERRDELVTPLHRHLDELEGLYAEAAARRR